MRTRRRRLLSSALLASYLAVSGCEHPLCALSVGYSLTIVVTDSITNAPLGGQATTVRVSDGTYEDPVFAAENVFLAVAERPGTYTVRVLRPGYQEWLRQGTRIRKEGCYTNRVRLDVRLQPVAGSR